MIHACTNCILDTHDDPNIQFDENGVCNYCNVYIEKYIKNALSAEQKRKLLEGYITQIKSQKGRKQYDCIMGLSGGVDSSYLALKAKEFGLNPLVVHFDNGWNSELAVKNIEGIIRKTGFDLFTYVVDWEEFKDLQLSYIKAGVLDWEIPTDHGFYACLYEQAYKHRIKYILTGHNYQTEAILPKSMRWSKLDVANIMDIHSKFGTKRIKTFPLLGFFKFTWFSFILKFQRVNLLEYLNYNKDQAKDLIKKEFNWSDYGGKHFESIFTRFYQGYVLKEKFGFDKRKAHLSNLILSGQMSRQQALEEIEKADYNPELLKQDFEFVAKKFDMSLDQFKSLLSAPNQSHLNFKSYETGLYRHHEKFMKKISPISRMFKSLIQ